MAEFYTIQPGDVGARFLYIFGRTVPLVDSIGYVQDHDVGKRLALAPNGIIYLESDDDYARRLRRERVRETLRQRTDRERIEMETPRRGYRRRPHVHVIGHKRSAR